VDTEPRWTDVDWAPHVKNTLILGRRLRYLDYGKGPPLLLVHGLGGAWQNWLENLPALGREFRVIAVDLPGFGGSDPLPPPAEMETHVEVLASLLDRLAIPDVVLVGHSLGGLIALLFASAYPTRLRGLVLVCAGGIALSRLRLAAIVRGFAVVNVGLGLPGVSRALALRPRLRHAMLAGALGDPTALSAPLAAQVIPLMASAPGFIGAVVAGGRAVRTVRPELVQTPTLLIWGDRDPILPVSQARELASTMPDARLVELEGVGHCPMFERPAEFNDELARFASRFSQG